MSQTGDIPAKAGNQAARRDAAHRRDVDFRWPRRARERPGPRHRVVHRAYCFLRAGGGWQPGTAVLTSGVRVQILQRQSARYSDGGLSAFRPMNSDSPFRVHVTAPARLHLGFLDLNGGLGRRFGSLGLTIGTFETGLHVERSRGFSATGPEAGQVTALAETFSRARGLDGGAHFTLERVIPPHAGLGSGTQMALAIGTALERLYGRDSGARAVARTLERGRRSGIGIGAFDEGGFIVDCGRGDLDEVPPVVMRLEFPAH